MNQNVVKEQIVKWIVDDFKPTAIDTDVDWIAAMERDKMLEKMREKIWIKRYNQLS